MSTQYISGHETFDDGDVQARNKANANAQRDAEFAREDLAWDFPGEAQANQVFWKRTFPHDVYITGVGFNAHFGPPSGGESLILRVKVAGATATQTYELAEAAVYDYIETDNETDILVTAGQTLELYFSQTGRADNVRGWVRIRKVKLA